MIGGITGRPGGGKSYEATRYHALPAILDDKRKVVTNIPIQKAHIAMLHGKEYAELVEVVSGQFENFGGERPFQSHEHFLQYKEWKNEKGQSVLFIIDEAHLVMGQRANQELLEFLSMHRHYGFDIIVLTQSHRKLHRDIRDMIDALYTCSKMQVYGQDGYVRKTFHGCSNMRDPIKIEERAYDAEYFNYYQSHTQSSQSIIEATVKDAQAKLNPYSKATKIFFLFAFFLFVFAGYRVFSKEDPKTYQELVSEQLTEQSEIIKQAVPQPITRAEVELKKRKEANEREQTINEEREEKLVNASKQYHPFHRVQLHVEGYYADYATVASKTFYSASMNGQKVFNLEIKDFLLAGYKVQVLGECLTEITYYEHRQFVICDAPTIGVNPTEVVQN